MSLRRRVRGRLEMKTTRKLILLLAHILRVFSIYTPAVTSPEREGVSRVGVVRRMNSDRGNRFCFL